MFSSKSSPIVSIYGLSIAPLIPSLTQELAWCMKDKPRRRGNKDWGSFDDELPEDCLGFMLFRRAVKPKIASSEELWRASLE